MNARKRAYAGYQRDLQKKLADERVAQRIQESESSASEYDDEMDYYEESPE